MPEILLKNAAALGEGAVWDSEKQVLYWVDIMGCKVYIYDPQTGENKGFDTPSHVGTVVTRESGGLMLALTEGFAALDTDSGQVEYLQKVEGEYPDNRFNDGKCDPAGRFWAGTMPYKGGDGGSLYRLDTDGSVHHQFGGVGCSNGLVWTSDNSTFYYIDTHKRRVDAFDYELATGAISNRRTAFECDPEKGFPDGCTIDEEDMIWIAFWGGGRVGRYNPATGECLENIEIPGAKQITSCAFGGANLNELYITSASEGLSDEKMIEQENAGSLFRHQVSVKGVKAPAFKG